MSFIENFPLRNLVRSIGRSMNTMCARVGLCMDRKIFAGAAAQPRWVMGLSKTLKPAPPLSGHYAEFGRSRSTVAYECILRWMHQKIGRRVPAVIVRLSHQTMFARKHISDP